MPFHLHPSECGLCRIIQRTVVGRMEYKGLRSDSSLGKSRWPERDGLAGSLSLERIYPIVLGSGFSGSSGSKESACYAGHPGSIPGSGRSPGEGNGNPLHDSCLGNPMNRGTWLVTVHEVTKTRIQLND